MYKKIIQSHFTHVLIIEMGENNIDIDKNRK